MSISEHLTTFAGLPVRRFDPVKKAKASSRPCAWFVGRLNEEEDPPFPELLDRFLDQHGGATTALVIGAWDYEEMLEWGEGAAPVVEALASNTKRLPKLSHLFFGDITYDECEISWIGHGDISALLPAFPKLEEFCIRGTSNLTFGKLSHAKLKTFVIESGGLREALLGEVMKANLPKLEALELWLGTDNYGGISTVDPLKPLLDGKLFRKLRHLGLRNCEIADAVARAVVRAPLLKRLHTLDLSLGNLTDVGAEALLSSPEIRKLKKLDVHHHFMSPPFVEALGEMDIEVDTRDAQKPYFSDYGDSTSVYRFIVASE
jgi:hypothetical protein